jgi:hypothetical protein
MTDSGVQSDKTAYLAVFTGELPYQIVMIGALLELLLLAVLAPRGLGAAPVGYIAVSGLRLVALLALGVIVGVQSNVSKKAGVIAIIVWGAILLPPELWAFALEARAGVPVSSVLSVMLSIGIVAALRWHARLGWIWVGIIALFLTGIGFNLGTLSPALLIAGFVGLAFLALKPMQRFDAQARKGIE